MAWPRVSARAASIVARVPIDATVMMNPNWLTVPYAMISLRSFWRRAIQPPIIMVKRPSGMMIGCHALVALKVGASRATRNTPALTIAAECRKEETGVGAAIAPGSQKWKGAIADLESAPMTSRIAAVEIAVEFSCDVVSAPGAVRSEKFQNPVVTPIRTIPTSMISPPSVVTRSAWPAARREEARSA